MREFLSSPQGIIARYNWRRTQRAFAVVKAIEPRAKSSMSENDKATFQRAVVRTLREGGRRPFRGPIALDLSTTTTDRNPTHLAQIAKNLLDLLAKPLSGVRVGRRGVLYYDDRQIAALSVTCRHEGPAADDSAYENRGPRIRISAVRHRLFLEDIAAAAEAERAIKDIVRDFDRDDEAVEEYLNLRSRPDAEALWGREGFGILLDHAARSAQQSVLRQSSLPFPVLALLNQAYHPTGGLPTRIREQIRQSMELALVRSPTRIWLSDLPARSGEGDSFREAVEAQVAIFWQQWEWLFAERLRVPIALEVLVKPPHGANASLLNDLDNVVRNYLVKPIVQRLQPPTDITLSFDEKVFAGRQVPEWLKPSRVPKSAQIGLTRYEVYRLPPGPSGFVSVGLAADPIGIGMMSRIDSILREWQKHAHG